MKRLAGRKQDLADLEQRVVDVSAYLELFLGAADGHERLYPISMGRYGPTVAIPRILDTYKRLELKQSFFIHTDFRMCSIMCLSYYLSLIYTLHIDEIHYLKCVVFKKFVRAL